MDNSIKLLRSTLFYTIPMEIGAPGMFPTAPLGSSCFLLDRVAQILDGESLASHEKIEFYARSYIQYLLDFPKLIEAAKISSGTYKVVRCSDFLENMSSGLSDEVFEEELKRGIDDNFSETIREFELTDGHISLAKAAYFSIDEAHQALPISKPGDELSVLSECLIQSHRGKEKELLYSEIVRSGNPKRPYGDSTYFYWDLEDRKIEGFQADGEYDERSKRRLFSRERTREINQLHWETDLALQALALYATF